MSNKGFIPSNRMRRTRKEFSVEVDVLNHDQLYKEKRAAEAGEPVALSAPIYKVTFYNYDTPVATWPTDSAGLGTLVIDWLLHGRRPE